MVKDLKAIDISDVPELLRIVREVRASNEPRLLRAANEDLAVLTPSKSSRRRSGRRVKTKEDYEAFRSAAGSWKDVDTEKFIADVYESRRHSSRPAVEL